MTAPTTPPATAEKPTETKERKKRVMTPEQLAKREERKKKKAAREAAFEQALMASKEAHPDIWKNLDLLIEKVTAIPTEEQAGTISVVDRVFRNRLRPGRKAKSREKLEKRLAKLREQQVKVLRELGESEEAIAAMLAPPAEAAAPA